MYINVYLTNLEISISTIKIMNCTLRYKLHIVTGIWNEKYLNRLLFTLRRMYEKGTLTEAPIFVHQLSDDRVNFVSCGKLLASI